MNPMHLVWLDVETTGLDPQQDQLLELHAALASFHDPFNITHLWCQNHILQCRSQENVDQYVLDMHAKTGLWGECVRSTSTPQMLDDELCMLVEQVIGKVPDRRSLVLAGFSVHFDLGFVRVNLPCFTKYLSHRVYDVSAVKMFCRSLGMPESGTPKEEAHRAEADVLESIAHAKLCVKWLRENYSRI